MLYLIKIQIRIRISMYKRWDSDPHQIVLDPQGFFTISFSDL